MANDVIDPSLWWADRKLEKPRNVGASFLESYLKAIERFGVQDFIHWYGIRSEHRKATFSEFHQDVKRAAALIEANAPRASITVTVAGNRYENLAFMIASLVLGRTLCPMNPDEGVDRIKGKLAALKAPYSVWIDPAISELQELTALGGQALRLMPEQLVPEKLNSCAPQKNQPMVLIFTSGSTGYSKIVEQTEAGILSNADDLIERHALGPGRKIATPLPIFHVNALEFSFLCALFSGAQLVLFERFTLPQALEVLQNEKCDILSIVPPILRSLVERADLVAQFDLTHLRYIVTAAAPLSVELVKACLEKLKIRVIQGYGLSEAVNFSCLTPAQLDEKEYLHWATSFEWPSIGTALRGNEVLVIGEDGQPVGEGVVGEICIRGRNVMYGYRGDQERSVFQGSMLHTGDLGKFHKDAEGVAYYFITGRKKETIKRYGMTVSLREIDDLVAAFGEPGFDAIAVPFLNLWSGEEVGLVAKQIPTWSPELEKRLENYLETRLPFHLRPKVVISTQASLRTASGKPCRWPFAKLFERFHDVTMSPQLRFFKDE
jgi:long-chain acyl-CoA synthetase